MTSSATPSTTRSWSVSSQLAVACISAFALLAMTAPVAGAVNSFSPTGSLVTARYFPSWGVLPDGKVLLAGGAQSSGGPGTLITSAELYDPAAGTWSATGSMATARFQPGFATLPDGKVLVAGGSTSFGSSNPVATSEIYDPATGTWSATGSMSIPRTQLGMVRLPDGKVLAGGGTTTGSSASATAEIYDPATGTWSATGSMTAASSFTSYVLLTSGKVLATSVGSGTGANLYDPATGTWSATGSASVGHRQGVFVALPGGKALLAGGTNSGPPGNSAEIYDSSTGTWSATGSMATARVVAAAALLANGNVLVAGGDTGASSGQSISDTAEIYDPAAGTFSAVGSMSIARAAAPAIPLPNGTILVPSGVTQSGGGAYSTTVTADIFAPTLPIATLSPATVDFGSRQVNSGASAAKTFTLSSSGDSPVIIGSEGPSVTGTNAAQYAVSGGTCMANASVAVGSSCTVEVTFNPTTTGSKPATLSVPTNVGAKTASLAGSGTSSGKVSVTGISYSNSQIRTRVKVSGAGRISQLGTRNASGASAAKTEAACRASTVTARKAGTYTLTCKLNSSTKKARRSGAVRVRLTTAFRPTGGAAKTTTSTVTLRSLRPQYAG